MIMCKNIQASAAFGRACFAARAEACLWQASARAVLLRCVSLYGQCYRIGTAKVQRFIHVGKGISQIVYVDGKIRQSTLYAGRGQPLLHRLQSQGVRG